MAFGAVVTSSAQAEDLECSAASGYLFIDFGELASDAPVVNCSKDFRAPLGLTGSLWGQVGEDDISNEIDLTFSTPSVSLGPVQFGAMGGVYYTPLLDDFTIATAQLTATTDVLGFTVQGTSQWYWVDVEDQRLELSVSRAFQLTEHVSVDFEVGRSWLDSGDTPDFLVVGLPIAGDEFTIRPFGKFSWNEDESNSVFGASVAW